MNLKTLFEMQHKLDNNILWNHPEVKEENLLQQKIIACMVEIGELANEWRGFKFWSKNNKPKEGMLEEFVDVLHFTLSIGIELGYQIDSVSLFDNEPPKDINEHFIGLNIAFGTLAFKKHVNKWQYVEILISVVQLGIELGFTPQQIVDAYFEKNKINFERQKEGY